MPNDLIRPDLFADRLSTTRPCHRCSGTGAVRDPHWLAPCAPIDGGPDGAISAIVVGSASIFEAMREAGDLSRRGDLPVVFHFIDSLVVVMPGDDPDLKARAWWIARYNETPEESWARR